MLQDLQSIGGHLELRLLTSLACTTYKNVQNTSQMEQRTWKTYFFQSRHVSLQSPGWRSYPLESLNRRIRPWPTGREWPTPDRWSKHLFQQSSNQTMPLGFLEKLRFPTVVMHVYVYIYLCYVCFAVNPIQHSNQKNGKDLQAMWWGHAWLKGLVEEALEFPQIDNVQSSQRRCSWVYIRASKKTTRQMMGARLGRTGWFGTWENANQLVMSRRVTCRLVDGRTWQSLFLPCREATAPSHLER